MVTAIAKVNAQFVDAFNAGDAARVSEVYEVAGKALPAGAPVLTGRSAIAALFQSVMSSGIATVALETFELFQGEAGPHPQTAVERGQYSFFDKDGTTKDVGKYIVVWAVEDGQFRYSLDMFSSNGPVSQ